MLKATTASSPWIRTPNLSVRAPLSQPWGPASSMSDMFVTSKGELSRTRLAKKSPLYPTPIISMMLTQKPGIRRALLLLLLCLVLPLNVQIPTSLKGVSGCYISWFLGGGKGRSSDSHQKSTSTEETKTRSSTSDDWIYKIKELTDTTTKGWHFLTKCNRFNLLKIWSLVSGKKWRTKWKNVF